MTAAAVTLAGRVQVRTGWRRVLTWVIGIAATMGLTVVSIHSLYDTQAKIDSYARATSTGDALRAINGRVYGLDTLGGVIQNEFGFVASCALPLMGVLLVAWATRREEESGRAELLLAGRLTRTAPLLATLLITAGALALTGLLIGAALVGVGIDADRATLYAASLALLGLAFAALTAVLAQLVPHARTAQGAAFLVLVAAYLLRGIGDVQWHPLVWASPLGWAEETRPFGDDPRWWPLLLPLAVSVALAAVAVAVRARRDLGQAVASRRPTTPVASAWLRSPIGSALAVHRGPLLTWVLVTAAVGGTFGSLATQVIDAMQGNPELATVMAGGGEGGVDGFLAMVVLMTALCATACGVHGVRTVGAEEAAGRVEPLLAAGWSRTRWFTAHRLVVAAGVVLVGLAGLVCGGLGVWGSTGDTDRLADLARAQASYLPATLLVTAIALLLHGIRQRAALLGWVLLAFCVVVALLGASLQLPDGVMDLSPLQHAGYPPQDFPSVTAVVVVSLLVVLAVAVGELTWRRRDIPG